MKFQTQLRLFLLLLFVIFHNCTTLFCQKKVIANYPFEKNPIKLVELPDFQVYVDTQNQSLDIKSLLQQNFKPGIDLEFSNVNHNYWFRFTPENRTNSSINYWLNTSVYDSLTLVQVEKEVIIIQHRGLLVNYDAFQKQQFQSLQEDKYGFPIHLQPNSKATFYLRIKNVVRFESLFSNIQLQLKGNQNLPSQVYFLVFNAVFFGILCFLALFSLLQYIQNKDPAYGYYALYLTFCNLYFWWKFEKANSFLNILFTNQPEAYYYFESPLSIFVYISYLFFIMHFINAKTEVPFFYKLLKWTSLALVAYLIIDRILVYILGFSLSWDIFHGLRVVMALFGFCTIYLVFKSKHQLVFYLLSGSFIMLLGSLLTTYLSKTMLQHYHGVWDIPLLPIQVAIIIEVFFFSIGLGYKSQLAEREKAVILQNLKLEQKEKNLEKQRKEQLTQWFTNISHEFRTPLTIIAGSANKITGHPREKAMIQRNSQQLLNLTNQVMTLNKLTAAKMTIQWKQGDIMAYLRILCEPFILLTQTKNQSINLSCQPDRFMMDFDKEKLRQIIGNLLSNALKFTPKNGQISIMASVKEQSKCQILKISVSDSGKGIPKEYHSSIFDPYVQMPNTEGGSGIGLALVKELTQLLGGKIQLEKQSGRGSLFTLSLPIHNLATTETTAPTCHNQISTISSSIPFKEPFAFELTRPTLLLVEDNPDMQQYIGKLLNTEYNILTAKNGQEGLEKALSLNPDIIVCDVMMPIMDGFVLCQQLKEKNSTQSIPVVLVTAKATHQDRLKGLACLADAYLTKPFDEQELLLQLAQLISKKRNNLLSNNLITPLISQPLQKESILFMKRFHQLVENNLDKENFRVKDICSALNINHVTLNNRVKEITGQSTAKYIRHYRLTKARKLLETTELTTSEIAWKVGIPEASNFSNMFKKAFGSSPRTWKNE